MIYKMKVLCELPTRKVVIAQELVFLNLNFLSTGKLSKPQFKYQSLLNTNQKLHRNPLKTDVKPMENWSKIVQKPIRNLYFTNSLKWRWSIFAFRVTYGVADHIHLYTVHACTIDHIWCGWLHPSIHGSCLYNRSLMVWMITSIYTRFMLVQSITYGVADHIHLYTVHACTIDHIWCGWSHPSIHGSCLYNRSHMVWLITSIYTRFMLVQSITYGVADHIHLYTVHAGTIDHIWCGWSHPSIHGSCLYNRSHMVWLITSIYTRFMLVQSITYGVVDHIHLYTVHACTINHIWCGWSHPSIHGSCLYNRSHMVWLITSIYTRFMPVQSITYGVADHIHLYTVHACTIDHIWCGWSHPSIHGSCLYNRSHMVWLITSIYTRFMLVQSITYGVADHIHLYTVHACTIDHIWCGWSHPSIHGSCLYNRSHMVWLITSIYTRFMPVQSITYGVADHIHLYTVHACTIDHIWCGWSHPSIHGSCLYNRSHIVWLITSIYTRFMLVQSITYGVADHIHLYTVHACTINHIWCGWSHPSIHGSCLYNRSHMVWLITSIYTLFMLVQSITYGVADQIHLYTVHACTIDHIWCGWSHPSIHGSCLYNQSHMVWLITSIYTRFMLVQSITYGVADHIHLYTVHACTIDHIWCGWSHPSIHGSCLYNQSHMVWLITSIYTRFMLVQSITYGVADHIHLYTVHACTIDHIWCGWSHPSIHGSCLYNRSHMVWLITSIYTRFMLVQSITYGVADHIHLYTVHACTIDHIWCGWSHPSIHGSCLYNRSHMVWLITSIYTRFMLVQSITYGGWSHPSIHGSCLYNRSHMVWLITSIYTRFMLVQSITYGVADHIHLYTVHACTIDHIWCGWSHPSIHGSCLYNRSHMVWLITSIYTLFMFVQSITYGVADQIHLYTVHACTIDHIWCGWSHPSIHGSCLYNRSHMVWLITSIYTRFMLVQSITYGVADHIHLYTVHACTIDHIWCGWSHPSIHGSCLYNQSHMVWLITSIYTRFMLVQSITYGVADHIHLYTVHACTIDHIWCGWSHPSIHGSCLYNRSHMVWLITSIYTRFMLVQSITYGVADHIHLYTVHACTIDHIWCGWSHPSIHGSCLYNRSHMVWLITSIYTRFMLVQSITYGVADHIHLYTVHACTIDHIWCGWSHPSIHGSCLYNRSHMVWLITSIYTRFMLVQSITYGVADHIHLYTVHACTINHIWCGWSHPSIHGSCLYNRSHMVWLITSIYTRFMLVQSITYGVADHIHLYTVHACTIDHIWCGWSHPSIHGSCLYNRSHMVWLITSIYTRFMLVQSITYGVADHIHLYTVHACTINHIWCGWSHPSIHGSCLYNRSHMVWLITSIYTLFMLVQSITYGVADHIHLYTVHACTINHIWCGWSHPSIHGSCLYNRSHMVWLITSIYTRFMLVQSITYGVADHIHLYTVHACTIDHIWCGWSHPSIHCSCLYNRSHMVWLITSIYTRFMPVQSITYGVADHIHLYTVHACTIDHIWCGWSHPSIHGSCLYNRSHMVWLITSIYTRFMLVQSITYGVADHIHLYTVHACTIDHIWCGWSHPSIHGSCLYNRSHMVWLITSIYTRFMPVQSITYGVADHIHLYTVHACTIDHIWCDWSHPSIHGSCLYNRSHMVWLITSIYTRFMLVQSITYGVADHIHLYTVHACTIDHIWCGWSHPSIHGSCLYNRSHMVWLITSIYTRFMPVQSITYGVADHIHLYTVHACTIDHIWCGWSHPSIHGSCLYNRSHMVWLITSIYTRFMLVQSITYGVADHIHLYTVHACTIDHIWCGWSHPSIHGSCLYNRSHMVWLITSIYTRFMLVQSITYGVADHIHLYTVHACTIDHIWCGWSHPSIHGSCLYNRSHMVWLITSIYTRFMLVQSITYGVADHIHLYTVHACTIDHIWCGWSHPSIHGSCLYNRSHMVWLITSIYTRFMLVQSITYGVADHIHLYTVHACTIDHIWCGWSHPSIHGSCLYNQSQSVQRINNHNFFLSSTFH